MNKTKNLFLLSLLTVSAQQAPLPVHVRTSSTPDQESLSAPGSDCLCQSRASSWSGGSVETQDSSPNPGLVNPESFLETSQSAGALRQRKPKISVLLSVLVARFGVSRMRDFFKVQKHIEPCFSERDFQPESRDAGPVVPVLAVLNPLVATHKVQGGGLVRI